MENQSELVVIMKAKELCAYIMNVTQRSPKQFRFTFVSRLQNLALEVIEDKDVLKILFMIIDSYETLLNKGLPLGNQSSQWFAIYYLDSLDRLIKEKLRLKFYSRYMDDGIIIHNDKDYLKQCLKEMRNETENNLLLQFNQKTQIIPLRNGGNYLGWHFYLKETGKIILKVTKRTKEKYKKKLKKLQKEYAEGQLTFKKVKSSFSSYHAHLSFGNTYRLRRKVLRDFILFRKEKRL